VTGIVEADEPRLGPDFAIGVTGFDDARTIVIIESNAGRKCEVSGYGFDAKSGQNGDGMAVDIASAGKCGLPGAIGRPKYVTATGETAKSEKGDRYFGNGRYHVSSPSFKDTLCSGGQVFHGGRNCT
jgi:hypothetical protein